MKKIITLLSLIILSFGCFAQLNYNAKSIYFTNADSATVRNNAANCNGCGFIYYNKQSTPPKFRAYENGTWKDLINTSAGNISGVVTSPWLTYASGVNTIGNAPWYVSAGRVVATTNGLQAPFNIGNSQPSDPISLLNADLWYNSTTGSFKGRKGGSTQDILTANLTVPGSIPFTTSTPGDGNLEENSNLGYDKISKNLFVVNASGNYLTQVFGGEIFLKQISPAITTSLITSGLQTDIPANFQFANSSTGKFEFLNKTIFTPSSTLAPINLGLSSGDPSSLSNGDYWYNSTINAFRVRSNGNTGTSLWAQTVTSDRLAIFGGTTGFMTNSANLTFNTGTSTLSTLNATLNGTLTSPNVTNAGTILLNNTSAGRTVSLTPNGAVYGADYSASYNNRSLVDKEFVSNVMGGMKVKVVNIGDWNMVSTASINVTHGLTDFKQIRQISVNIRDDADTQYTLLTSGDSGSGTAFGVIAGQTSTNIQLFRIAGVGFDSSNYDATSYNRGFVTIWYVDNF